MATHNHSPCETAREIWKGLRVRVISGKYRSRPLRSLRGMDVRPTADRLRETLFDVITAGNPSALAGRIWLDVYAGTGAVGIEALSRGAGMVYFVESSPRAGEVIRANLQALGAIAGWQILKQDAVRGMKTLEVAGVVADCIFLDPPYYMQDEYWRSLEFLAGSALLKAECVVVAEHLKRFDPGVEFKSLQRYRKLEQGDAALSFYRWSAQTSH